MKQNSIRVSEPTEEYEITFTINLDKKEDRNTVHPTEKKLHSQRLRIPDDPCVRAFWQLNREFRPDWERRVLEWARSNNFELEGMP